MLKESVHSLCLEQEDMVQKILKQKLQDMSAYAQKEVPKAYDNFVSTVLNEYVSQQESIRQAQAKKELIKEILEEELPQMERLLLQRNCI